MSDEPRDGATDADRPSSLADPLAVAVRRVQGPPLMAIRAFFVGGARVEEIPGQALVTGRALTEGTRTRDWRQISADAESLGLSIQSSATFDLHGVSIDGLARHWEQALDWTLEILSEPAFSPERCLWTVRQTGAELDSLADQPEVVTAWAFLEQLYTPNPRSRPIQGTLDGLARLDSEALAAFHEYTMGLGLRVTLAGAIDEDSGMERIHDRFTPLATSVPPSPLRPVPPAQGLPDPRREIRLPPGDQGHLYAGCLTVSRDHDDFTPLEVLSVILGAGSGLTGRIPERVRESEGLAYSVQIQTTSGAGYDPGRLMIYAGTSPATLAQAERAVREEMEGLVAHGVTQDELDAARGYLLGREPFRRETARQWAGLLGNDLLYGAGDADPDRRRRLLERITVERLDEVAGQYLGEGCLRWTLGVPG